MTSSSSSELSGGRRAFFSKSPLASCEKIIVSVGNKTSE